MHLHLFEGLRPLLLASVVDSLSLSPGPVDVLPEEGIAEKKNPKN